MDDRVQRTIATMHEQLHRRLTVVELATRAGLSVAHLTRLFRDATGATPAAFLHRLRMERARILLERTSLTVHEVMTQVGIADRSHFARDFMRTYGSSPRQFRVDILSDRAADV